MQSDFPLNLWPMFSPKFESICMVHFPKKKKKKKKRIEKKETKMVLGLTGLYLSVFIKFLFSVEIIRDFLFCICRLN